MVVSRDGVATWLVKAVSLPKVGVSTCVRVARHIKIIRLGILLGNKIKGVINLLELRDEFGVGCRSSQGLVVVGLAFLDRLKRVEEVIIIEVYIQLFGVQRLDLVILFAAHIELAI